MKLGALVLTVSALGLLVSHSDALAARGRPAVENYQKVGLRNGDPSGIAVLFDNSHAQTAGNADWTTTGGYSDFADDLRHHGFKVTSHDRGEIDASKLAGIKVLVVPEPNTRMTAREIQAIQEFVKAGGGLFAIGDHHGSDRNGDGWDSPKIWNEITPAWGITFNKDKHYEDPLTGAVSGSPLAQSVKRLGCWAGASLSLTGAAKAEFKFSSVNGGSAFVASATSGTGRVVVIGDSSPFDDGTGAPGNALHDGYKQYEIPQFGLNTVNWLAGKPFEPLDR